MNPRYSTTLGEDQSADVLLRRRRRPPFRFGAVAFPPSRRPQMVQLPDAAVFASLQTHKYWRDDALTLTGPYQALAGDVMYFEVNLKIIMGDEEAVDQEFSKGLMQRNILTSLSCVLTLSLNSCLSKVELDFNDIPNAWQASIEVNILNEESYFHGKITAGYEGNEMLLYDSKVAGTETKLGCGGSVSLTRRVVDVPGGSDLDLCFSVHRAKSKSIRLEHYEEGSTFKLGTYDMQVKIVWTGVLRKHRKNVLKEIGRGLVIL